MRRSFALLLCAFLPAHAASALARGAEGFAPAGRTPEGDFDLEVELEVLDPARLEGRIHLCRGRDARSAGIELRGGAGPVLFHESVKLSAKERKRTSPAATRGKHLLVARRREGPKGLASFALEVDGRTADVLYAPVGGGREARYGPGALRGARIVRLTVRRVEEAFLGDDFTRDAEETSPWRAVEGKWDIATTRDAWVAVDRGPFATSSYRARPAEGKAAVCLAEPARLGRIHVSVAARIPADAEAGIVFGACLRDGGRAGGADGKQAMRVLLVKPGPDGKGSARLVVWGHLAGREGQAPSSTHPAGAAGPTRDPRKVSPSTPIAGPARAHVRPGAWTHFEVWSDWDYIRVAVAGRVVLEADLAECPAGKVGLMALGRRPVFFDDFQVRPWHVVHERRPGERVQWKTSPAPGPTGARLMTLSTPWPLRNYRLCLRAEKGSVFPVLAGKAFVPEAAWRPAGKGPYSRPATLALDVKGPHVLTFADGRRRGEVTLDGPPDGPPGILTRPGSACGRVVLEPSRRPLEVGLFSSDFSVPAVKLPYDRGYVRVVGDLLSPPAGMWRCVRRGKQAFLEAAAAGLAVAWFYRPCPGDLRVEADLLVPAEAAFNQAGVVMAAERDKAGKLRRYTLSIERMKGTEFVLRRDAAKVAGAKVAIKGPRPEAVRIALERRGDRLFGYLEDELLLKWRDAEPLTGDHAGLFVTKGKAAFDRVAIRHLRATRCSFRKVEPDWQPLSGRWLLHTGLMCIAWDHWITAFGSPGGAARMGLLRPVSIAAARPDVCVVARVSEAGEGYENRTHVHYPMHDVSITLRGRLEDPGRSGYRILIAPLPEKRRIILYRNGREVANEQGVIFVMAGHNNTPRDFTVVARAVGGRVSCSISGTEFLSWTDPDPLPAGRVILGAEKGRVNFADVTVMDVSGSCRQR